MLPDECVVEVNHRFAPDRSEEEAQAYVRELFDGYEVTVLDSAPGALPGLDLPAAKAFIEAVGREVNPKFGWTDVARFTALGIPAVNFGPGRPDAGPQAGGARARGAPRPLRAAAHGVADRVTPRTNRPRTASHLT